MKSVGTTGALSPVATPPSSPPLAAPFPDITVDVNVDSDEEATVGAGGMLTTATTGEDTSARGFTKSDDAPADVAGVGDENDAEKQAAVMAAAKREKRLKKAIKDYMKTSLSSERTFFKWVWTGLNLGALGMFSLAFFEDTTPFPYRLLLTGTAWAAGLLTALYGLRQFHRRRRALLTATDDPAAWESPRALANVVGVFADMLALMVVYAVASHQTFRIHAPTALGEGER
ncbi:hypothetical protein MMPV_004879 [Pyropia vietnamensis]